MKFRVAPQFVFADKVLHVIVGRVLEHVFRRIVLHDASILMTVMRSASLMASSISWVTNTMVLCSFC